MRSANRPGYPAGGVQVVADQDRLPDRVVGPDPAGRIGQDDGPAARRDRGPHPVHDSGRLMPLIQVHPAEEEQDALAIGVQVADGAAVPRRRRRREAAEVR